MNRSRTIPVPWTRLSLLTAVILLVPLLAGCKPQEIESTYGRRRSLTGGDSVNGTSVLGAMFKQAGYRVNSWRRLSPKLDDYDVIVWAPDDFQPPTQEQRGFLEGWLWEDGPRTLVYIGRDYDAYQQYWRTVRDSAPADQVMEIERRLAAGLSEYEAARVGIPKDKSFDWFRVRRDVPLRTAEELSGPWSIGIDASKTTIELASRFEHPTEFEIDHWYSREDNIWDDRPNYQSLLSSRGETIVSRMVIPEWPNSQLLVVTNGSFLLNFPLANKEHRKLAQHLIDECGPPGRVVFLESGPEGPLLLAADPDARSPTGLEIFTVWPLGIIMMHLAIAGITLCVAYFPIFGRPRDLQVASPSDFGQHVTALGELFEKTQNQHYAIRRLQYYNEHVRRDANDR